MSGGPDRRSSPISVPQGQAETPLYGENGNMICRLWRGWTAPENADALRHAIRRVVAAHADRSIWAAIQKQGMKSDVSWEHSARKYVQLYKSLIAKGQAAG